MGEGSVWGRVGDVVGRDVNRLQRSDRSSLERRDPFLERAHLAGQRRLVADRRGHPAEQSRDLRTGLGETEDVVDEEQHVLALDVAEVLGHRQGRERDSQPDPRRLVHLSENQGRLFDDPRLGHLEIEVVAFPGALSDPGEHRDPAVLLGYPADHLLDQDCLADSRTSEESDLSALQIGADEVEDFDPGLEDLLLRSDVLERRRLTMNRPARLAKHLVGCVECVAPDVEEMAQSLVAHRHRDRFTEVANLGPPHETVGRGKRNRPHLVATEVLCGLGLDRLLVAPDRDVDLEGEEQLRQAIGRELDVDHRPRHLHDASERVSLRFRLIHWA